MDELQALLTEQTKIPAEEILISTRTLGHVDIRVFRDLTADTRRQIHAVLKLHVPVHLCWTVRAGEPDDFEDERLIT